MALPETLRALLTAPGPSGRESGAAAVWTQAAEAFAQDVRTDLLGSATAVVPGTGDGPRLAVVGHIDEIGVMVTHVDDEGFLWFGGVGDWGVIAGEPLELGGDRWASRSMDNRLGCFIALEAARLVSEAGGAPGDVVACAVAQEETTFGGSTTTAYTLEPDVAIVVDVTHATDAPGIDKRVEGDHGLGAGAVINTGSVAHPLVVKHLREAAEAESIPFAEEAGTRSTSTDADAVHLSRRGVPCSVVSIPLRYMHSPVEVVQLSDVDACARLIAAFAQRLGAGTTFVR